MYAISYSTVRLCISIRSIAISLLSVSPNIRPKARILTEGWTDNYCDYTCHLQREVAGPWRTSELWCDFKDPE